MRLFDPHSWPVHRDPADPFDGASTLPDADASWEDHRSWARPALPDQETWAAIDLRWQQLAWQVLRGERAWGDPELAAAAGALGLIGPRKPDRRPLPVAPWDPPLALQVDLVENHAPDLPEAALDFVLGPYGELSPSPALRRLAAAVMLFSKVHSHGRSTVDVWGRDADRPTLAQRRGLKSLGRAPACLWRVEAERWSPLLPLMPGAVPSGPVAGSVTPLVPGPTPVAVARVVPQADGRWVAHTALGLPEAPPRDLLLRRLTLALQRVRRQNRRATWEDVLRARAPLLYRICATWTAAAREDA